MKTDESICGKQLVLVGGGHAHVEVVRALANRPVKGLEVLLVSQSTAASYSGMLPAAVEGRYSEEEISIDLDRLAAASGISFIRARALGLDPDRRLLLCEGRPQLPFDLLSINTGAAPSQEIKGERERILTVKPIHDLLAKFDRLRQRLRNPKGIVHIAVVGAGASGVELAMAARLRLRREFSEKGLDPDRLHFAIFSAGDRILAEQSAIARRLAHRALARQGIEVHTRCRIARIDRDAVRASDGRAFAAHEVLWATEAHPLSWFSDSGLQLQDGFIAVDSCLRSISHPHIFAAGDTAVMEGEARPRAGVFAVRAGPPLAENLRRAARGQKLRPYRPQRQYLTIIGTADGSAIACRGPWALSGSWCRSYKDRLDRSFIRKYSEFQPRRAQFDVSALETLDAGDGHHKGDPAFSAWRCSGCGAKTTHSVLAAVLNELAGKGAQSSANELNPALDASATPLDDGRLLIQSADLLSRFVDDLYLFGRITAFHALADLHASGARPAGALALATLAPATEAVQRRRLLQLLAGVRDALKEEGAVLIGGHTAEGPQPSLGLAVHGFADSGAPELPAPAAGDALILTKPLGSGLALAARMRLAVKGRVIEAVLAGLNQSQQQAAIILRRHGCPLMTDVTGFGCARHSLNLLKRARARAEIDLGAIPLYPGIGELLAGEIRSSLHHANARSAEADLKWAEKDANIDLSRRASILFDPQTAGPLLALVPQKQAAACLEQLQAAGYGESAVIGRILERHAAQGAAEPALTIR